MSRLTFPLGGNVAQAWNWWLNQSMRQFGLINIEQTVSSDPDLEHRIITEVASYGKQLGRITDALSAVLNHNQDSALTNEERKAVSEFMEMAAKIEDEKRRYGASVEDMLDHIVDEVASKKDSEFARRIAGKMRDAIVMLESANGNA